MAQLTNDGTSLLLAGMMNAASNDEFFFKSYGNVIAGHAVVQSVAVSALGSSTPSSSSATWTFTSTSYLTSKAARPLSDGSVIALLYAEEQQATLVKLSAAGAVEAGPADFGAQHGEGTDVVLARDGSGFVISGHGDGGVAGTLSGRLSKVSSTLTYEWGQSYSSIPYDGTAGASARLIKNECWGLQPLADGYVVGCGTGIEDCAGLSGSLLTDCNAGTADARTGAAPRPASVWLSMVFRTDLSGTLVWLRADQYRASGDPAVGTSGWAAQSSASEYVLAMSDGGLVSINDEVGGIGLLRLDGGAGSGGGAGGAGRGGTLGTCPSSPLPVVRDLDDDRAACTADCNTAGFCCTTDMGGCGQMTCSGGCHLAWYSTSVDACIAACQTANAAGCSYRHEPSNDITTHVDFSTCFGHEACGCPTAGDANHDPNNLWGPSNDCSGGGCARGCALAASTYGHAFYGRNLTADEIGFRRSTTGGHEASTMAAVARLRAHVDVGGAGGGPSVLSGMQLAVAAATVERHGQQLAFNQSLLVQTLDLIDAFEASASFGPLFVSTGPFMRGQNVGDGRDTHRALLAVQQAVLDHVYNARPAVVLPCSISLFASREWLTSSYVPGAVDPPADPSSVVHSVTLELEHPATWGHRVGYGHQDAKKPTGLYLAPGAVATVSVPQAVVDAGGFKVLIGCQTHDNAPKSMHKRLDRVTVTYAIEAVSTTIVSPLGGGIYVLVPYRAALGLVSVTVSGGVVQAPLFRRTSFDRMSNAQWATRRAAAGPWADFETDKFMLSVPSSWIRNFDDPTTLLADYDLAMDATAEWGGYPPALRRDAGVHTLYLMPDLHIAHPAYGTGYPQTNVIYEPGASYNGNVDHWLLRRPVGWSTTWHELGHTQQRQAAEFQYAAETEAIVNFLWAYLQHVKFGESFNTAFKTSRGGEGQYEPDDAAVHWMLTDNFRNGREMGRHNPNQEYQYQHRGYAKYADIARCFGWQAYTRAYYTENANFEAGVSGPGAGLAGYGYQARTLRLSIAAGYDLTPLIHFWGIHPLEPAALAAEMQAHSLGPSLKPETESTIS